MTPKTIDNLKTAGCCVLAVAVIIIGGLVRESIADAFKGTWVHRVCSLVSGL